MEGLFQEKHKTALIPVAFNNNDIKRYPHQKHLSIVLDSKLDFKFHVDQN